MLCSCKRYKTIDHRSLISTSSTLKEDDDGIKDSIYHREGYFHIPLSPWYVLNKKMFPTWTVPFHTVGFVNRLTIIHHIDDDVIADRLYDRRQQVGAFHIIQWWWFNHRFCDCCCYKLQVHLPHMNIQKEVREIVIFGFVPPTNKNKAITYKNHRTELQFLDMR